MFHQTTTRCESNASSDSDASPVAPCRSDSSMELGNASPERATVLTHSEADASSVAETSRCTDGLASAIDGFIEMLRKDMQILESKVNREDSLTVASVAYRVKSKAKDLGILSIHRSADQIETCARRNQIAQLTAEIDLMRHQVELFVRSCGKEKHPEVTGGSPNRHC